MRIRNLLLGFIVLTATLGLYLTNGDSREHGGARLVVVQGTPGDGFVHKTFRLNDETPDADGTEQATPSRAWSIYLTGEQPFAGETKADGVARPSPTLIWARPTESGSIDLVYSRFDEGAWTDPLLVSTDETGELAASWWRGSLLTFVMGAPGSSEPGEGTPGDPVLHDQGPTAIIETLDGVSQSSLPHRRWTIYIDRSILVVPSSGILHDGEPALNVMQHGDTIIPTATWAHAVIDGNHDPVMARFVNGAWAPAETIATSALDDRHPRIAQNNESALHAVWGRDAGNGSFDEEVFHANEPVGAESFSSEVRVSRTDESAFNPSVAVLVPGMVFVAYESEREDTAPRVIVARGAERKDGIGYTFRHRVAGRTSGEVPADPDLASLGGERLLLTWVASPSRLEFRVFSNGRWTPTEFEPIARTETATDVRRRLLTSLLNGEAEGRERRPEDH